MYVYTSLTPNFRPFYHNNSLLRETLLYHHYDLTFSALSSRPYVECPLKNPEPLVYGIPHQSPYESYGGVGAPFRWERKQHNQKRVPQQNRLLPMSFPSPGETAVRIARKTIEDKWKSLGGAPGRPKTTSFLFVEKVGGGYRTIFENGAIYTKNISGPAFWIHGDIEKKWNELNGIQSWLGFPTSDILPIKYDNGDVMSFEKGEIYFWPETGPIEIDQIVLTFKGIHCFAKTKWLGLDDIYAIFSVIPPGEEPITRMTKLYRDVNDGQSHPDYIEIYRGKPNGLTLDFILMEQDGGDPNKYLKQVESSVKAATSAATVAISVAGTPTAAAITGPILNALVPVVSKGVNSLLGTADDFLGEYTKYLTLKEMIKLSASPDELVQNNQIQYKLETELFTGKGASYKGYFSVSRA